jgi:hypothetical protein
MRAVSTERMLPQVRFRNDFRYFERTGYGASHNFISGPAARFAAIALASPHLHTARFHPLCIVQRSKAVGAITTTAEINPFDAKFDFR